MSVVNQMLQDLDRRQAPAAVLDPLPGNIRPLPPPRRSGLPWMLGAAAALSVAGSAFAWWIAQGTASGQGTPAPATDQPPAIAPLVQAAPAQIAEPASTQPEKLPVEEPVAGDAPGGASPVAPAVAKTETEPDAQAVADSRGAQRRKLVAMAMPDPPAHAAAGPTRLEKRDRPTTPRERAERAHGQAALWLSKGDAGEAERSLREALREDPTYAAARQAFAGLLAEQGRTEEARQALLEGLTAAPQDTALAIAAARMLAQGGDAPGALRVLDDAAGGGHPGAEFRGLRAAILQKLCRHAEAIEDYQAALRLSPDAGVWWLGLGLSLEAQGQAADAREAFQRAGLSGALAPDLTAFVQQKLRRLP
jgi:MSHA biogenesis protein MshN